MKVFQEQMDTTKQEARAEIEAFFNNRIRSIAQAAIVENAEETRKLANPIDV